MITEEMMEYVGILAQLELSGEAVEKARDDMERMLEYIDQLNELDTDGVKPLSHVFPVYNVFREDEVTNGEFVSPLFARVSKFAALCTKISAIHRDHIPIFYYIPFC